MSTLENMRISAQEEYGLRCLLRLAQDGEGACSTLSKIADAEGLGREYAGKLMQQMRQAGLVESVRGPGGGYRLARPADQITVAGVVNVLGGVLFPEDFCDCHPGRAPQCVRRNNCSLRALWRIVHQTTQEILEQVTLEDLLIDEESMALRLGVGDVAEGA